MKKQDRRVTVSSGSIAQNTASPTKLVQALLSRQDNTATDIAKAARVGIETAQNVLNGRIAARKDQWSSKQLRGRVRSLARLARLAGLELATVLREYGIDPDDPRVRSGLAEFSGSRERAYRGKVDPVLDRIAQRTPGGKVMFGIFHWPPFSSTDPTEEGWIERYASRLIGCVNPNWEKPSLEEVRRDYNSLADVSDDLTSPTSSCDFVAPIYDTAYRRIQGMTFVHIPGIGVPLDVLFIGHASDPKWTTVFDSTPRKGTSGRAFAVVARTEIGHLYVQGPMCYPARAVVYDSTARDYEREDIDIVGDLSTSVLVKRFRRAIEHVTDRPVLFVCDAIKCAQVYDNLKQTLPVRKLSAVGDEWGNAPAYRVGLALPQNSERWRDALLLAQREELFRNCFHVTAHHYATLFQNAGLTIRALPFRENDIPAAILPDFYKAFARDLEGMTDYAGVHNTQLDACHHAWLGTKRLSVDTAT